MNVHHNIYLNAYFSVSNKLAKGVSLDQELFNEDVIRLNSKYSESSVLNENIHSLESNNQTDIAVRSLVNDGQESLINESFEVSLASSVCDEGSVDETFNNLENEQELYDPHSSASSGNKVWLT